MSRSGGVRIIAGRWRGRRLPVPEGRGLRPTPDRVRETLFNWLAPDLSGAHCLDLFAGSGVLGLEALSRGASGAVLVERAAPVAHSLREQVTRLEAEAVRVEQQDALRWLKGPAEPFDIVFLDPPFDADLWQPVAAALEAGGWLAADARIYAETPAHGEEPIWPATWYHHRQRIAGGVRYDLLRRGIPETDGEA
ncbi:MAG: 16S rRNA (guanine(966)-N(2))-methyltransferase RsmD [Thiohalospira sp.]